MPEVKNIAIGGAALSLGDYVAAGGAGTLADVGLLKDGSEITIQREMYEVKSDSAQGVLRAVPTDIGYEVKAILQEATLANFRKVTGQPSANLTGTAPNATMEGGEAAEEYFQATIVTKGTAGATGVYATRTYTFWKLYVKGVEALPIKKGQEQTYGVTFGAAEDLSVSAAGKFFKVADTSGS